MSRRIPHSRSAPDKLVKISGEDRSRELLSIFFFSVVKRQPAVEGFTFENGELSTVKMLRKRCNGPNSRGTLQRRKRVSNYIRTHPRKFFISRKYIFKGFSYAFAGRRMISEKRKENLQVKILQFLFRRLHIIIRSLPISQKRTYRRIRPGCIMPL